MANKNLVYWDSCTYIDFLRGDHPLHAHMEALQRDWREGKVTMVTSAVTLTEVLWVKCPPNDIRRALKSADERLIRDAFDPSPPATLIVVETSRETAEHARRLVWRHNIKPKDAIHIVSAVEANAPLMQTSDEKLWKFSLKIGGDPPLMIERPNWERQAKLDDLKVGGAPPSSPASASL